MVVDIGRLLQIGFCFGNFSILVVQLEIVDQRLAEGVGIGAEADPAPQRFAFFRKAQPRIFQAHDKFVDDERMPPA